MTLTYATHELGRFESLRRTGIPPEEAEREVRFWAWVTLFLYFAAIITLYVPVAFLCFGIPDAGSDLEYILSAIGEWWFWLIVGVLLLAQALLLAVPVEASWNYRLKPRKLVVSIATACTLLAILVAGAAISVLVLGFWDDKQPIAIISGGLVVIASWVAWWLIFRRQGRGNPDHITANTQRTLIRGSIAELLVAVSCHIWVRARGDCSAPTYTFIAICAGLAILLCAFGPGVFYLFARRARQMRSRKKRLGDQTTLDKTIADA